MPRLRAGAVFNEAGAMRSGDAMAMLYASEISVVMTSTRRRQSASEILASPLRLEFHASTRPARAAPERGLEISLPWRAIEPFNEAGAIQRRRERIQDSESLTISLNEAGAFSAESGQQPDHRASPPRPSTSRAIQRRRGLRSGLMYSLCGAFMGPRQSGVGERPGCRRLCPFRGFNEARAASCAPRAPIKLITRRFQASRSPRTDNSKRTRCPAPRRRNVPLQPVEITEGSTCSVL